jgi:cytochrome c556
MLSVLCCSVLPPEEIMAQTTTLLFAIVAVLASARAAGPQVDPPPQPAAVLDNVDLMDLMVKPAYDDLQQAMAGPPADRKAWAALYQKAARLAELENLLFFRTRAGDARRAEWAARAARARQAAADVAAAALLGLRSARPADFEILRATFPAVSDGCTACHRAFAREAPVIKP